MHGCIIYIDSIIASQASQITWLHSARRSNPQPPDFSLLFPAFRTYQAGNFGLVIDAAGAWCDKLAEMAGVVPVALVPKRRTVLIFDPPPGAEINDWPAVIDVDETFYFKPEAGRILGSPADESPTEPCDVHPDDLDIAIAVERIEAAADLPINHIRNRWAGLRSFVADKCPVVGFDPKVPGFFWLAGQGGYGIQTSPVMGRVCAGLVTEKGLPHELIELGVTEAALSPARFTARA